MQGIDMEAVWAVRHATSRRVTAAGGVRSPSEVEALHEIGVDAVVGMALYTGKFEIPGRS
jgi:phosphoribosylformimino-5-aminoimidazole carboxamide ribotide isomerase